MAKLAQSDLLMVSKSDKKSINHFRLGVRLKQSSNLEIDELTELACKDRLGFGSTILKCARWAIYAPAPQYRFGLARAYYAMYHAARAAVYFAEGGDDHEAHQELPRHIPKDFPDRDLWENELKTARLERNRADYDPYPKADKAFAKSAIYTLGQAEKFLPAIRRYLIKRGCQL